MNPLTELANKATHLISDFSNYLTSRDDTLPASFTPKLRSHTMSLLSSKYELLLQHITQQFPALFLSSPLPLSTSQSPNLSPSKQYKSTQTELILQINSLLGSLAQSYTENYHALIYNVRIDAALQGLQSVIQNQSLSNSNVLHSENSAQNHVLNNDQDEFEEYMKELKSKIYTYSHASMQNTISKIIPSVKNSNSPTEEQISQKRSIHLLNKHLVIRPFINQTY